MATAFASLPEIRGSRCVRHRFRYSGCTRCADSCPPGALEPGEEGVRLDGGRCTGCGLCVTACPTAAFHLPQLPLAALTRPKAQSLTVACAPSGMEGEVRVPCLGDLDLALIISLGQRRIAVTLCGAGACETCANAPAGRERVEELTAMLGEIDAAALEQGLPWCSPTVDTDTADVGFRADRRHLFRRWSHRAIESARADAAELQPPASAIRVAAHFVPARRRLAEAVLGRFDSAPDSSELARMLDVGVVEAGAGHCTGCEICARVCPSGALKVSEEETRWRLQFKVEQCVGCGVCIEACRAGALTLEHRWQPAADEPVCLHAQSRFRCSGCGRFFIGLQDDICPVCSDDQESFEAIFG